MIRYGQDKTATQHNIDITIFKEERKISKDLSVALDFGE